MICLWQAYRRSALLGEALVFGRLGDLDEMSEGEEETLSNPKADGFGPEMS